MIHFAFPNRVTLAARIIQATPPRYFAIRYYGDTLAAFTLEDDGEGGTDLLLTDSGVRSEARAEVIEGWVSVLMALNAAVDFGVDLRTHDARRHWDHSYVEN